jgi:hypothetical protein
VETYFRPEVAKVMLSSHDMMTSQVLAEVKLTDVLKDQWFKTQYVLCKRLEPQTVPMEVKQGFQPPKTNQYIPTDCDLSSFKNMPIVTKNPTPVLIKTEKATIWIGCDHVHLKP